MIAVRLVWVVVLGLTAGRPGRPDTTPVVAWTARVLAVRHLIESALLARRGDRQPPRWAVTVDALHGLSMVAVAMVSRPLRPPALCSAAAAAAISSVSGLERHRRRA